MVWSALAVYLAMNVVMDGAVLYVAARLGGEAISLRLAAAALAGTAYAAVPPAWSGGVVGHLLCAFVMIGLAYGFASPRRTATRFFLLLVAALLVGGAGLAGVAALGMGAPSAARPLPFVGLVAGCLAVVAAERLAAHWRLRAYGGGDLDLDVEVAGAHVRLRGLVDTGNRLRDPVGLMPVVVAEALPLAGLWPPALRGAFAREVAAGLGADRLAELNPAWATRLCVVPYHSVGGAGLLTAVRPDALRAWIGGRPVTVSGVVAISPRPLGVRRADAIVPPALVPAISSPIGA